ncbi:MAG: hypothetical protein JSS86_10355, partial [Cyanobacteria bacterium SZAS LIN-2]|nr:hypothetical protein [Cyanobacteria bacterium SZAS LIN-2]
SPDYVGNINKPSSTSRSLGNPINVTTLTGTVTPGDTISVNASNQALVTTSAFIAGDTLQSIAAKVAATVNASSAMQAVGVTAVAAGNTISYHSDNALVKSYGVYSNPFGSASELVSTKSAGVNTATVTIGGTPFTGDKVRLQVYTPWPYHYETMDYTVVGGDTLNSIASGLAALVNADSYLAPYGISATAVGPIVYLRTYILEVGSPPYQTSIVPASGGGTETIAVSDVRDGSVQLETAQYNSIGKITQSVDAQCRTVSYDYDTNKIDLLRVRETQGADNFQIGAWTYNSAHLPLTSTDGSGRVTQYSYLNYTNQIRTITDANSNVTTFVYPETTTATVGGTISNNFLQTITVFDAALPGGQQAATFTEHTGDTTTTIAAGLVASINGNANLQTAGITATNAANVITITSTSANLTTYTSTVTGSITIALGATKYGYLSKIDGPLAGSQDVTTFTYDGYGRVYTVTDSEGYTLTFSYDAANRPTQTLYPDGTTEQTIYSNLDPAITIDRLGRSTQRAYDVMEQVSYEVDPLGRKTQYTWCTCGSPVTLTDPAGHVTTWQHDLQGRTTKKTYQDTTFSTYSYDPAVGRLVSSTDALSQTKNYSYYPDDSAYQTSYVGAINPTSVITRKWDPNYMRPASMQNDWGTISYTYNPYIVPGGAATTGGGRLQLVHNTAIANSDTTYSYDNLGRTTNRSINGVANSDTWTFDAMNRVTAETNTLGSFNYAYVDNVAGSSKGTTRLASVTYPNSQVTNYSWYPTVGDERLQQISNRKTATGATISQYGQVYDSAGQITQWQQLQNNQSLAYSLSYDQAGQLSGSQAGSGGPSTSYLRQNYFAYDLASNRTGSQQNTVDRIGLGGTVTTGNTLTVTVNNSGLTGGTQAVSYTVVGGDTLTTIATKLAAALTSNSNLQTAGINATSNGAVINVRSSTPNLSTYVGSTNGGATETVSIGVTGNFVENAVIGGTKTTSNTVTISVIDPALSGGKTDITYTVLAGDTLATIATGLKNAINANSGLTAAGITATVVGTVISIKSTSVNATTYAQSTSASATETIALSVNQNGPQTIALAGTKTTGNVITTTFYDAGLPSGSQAIAYTVLAGDTLTSIATAMASAINGNSNLQNIGVSASSSATVVTVLSNSINATTLRSTANSGGTEAVLVNVPANGTETAYIGGTKTTGNVLTLTVYDAGLATGSQAVTYTVLAADTLTTIATGLAAAVNGNANLTAIGVSATSSSQVINIKSTSVYLTSYAQSVTGTETITLAPAASASLYGYNNVNELTSISSGGSTLFQANANKALKSATVAGSAALLNWSQTFSGNATLSSGANTVAVTATDGVPNVKSNSYQVVAKGPANATPTYDANGNMTSDGTNSFSWDAENRLTQITYPGTGNNTQFTFDGYSGLVKIVETTSSSVTSTKQFIRCGSKICEERNAGGTLVKQFFRWGQTISATNYLYTRDHLGSIRDMTDSSGAIQAHYEYDVWGQPTKTAGALDADFGYAGYYAHQRSGLNLTVYRAYSPSLGRWINRDPMAEFDGVNLYTYCANGPTEAVDPNGTFLVVIVLGAEVLLGPAEVALLGATAIVAAGALGEAIGHGISSLAMGHKQINPSTDLKTEIGVVINQTGRGSVCCWLATQKKAAEAAKKATPKSKKAERAILSARITDLRRAEKAYGCITSSLDVDEPE